MSWVKVYVHTVFTTKNRYPFLSTKILRDKLNTHILENAKIKNIYIDSIGGYADHLHCLISLNKDLSIKDTMQLIKGESSFWMNREKLIKDHFMWQDDYWMVGVSESHISRVRNYIRTQEAHHSKASFTQELNEFLEENGWEVLKD